MYDRAGIVSLGEVLREIKNSKMETKETAVFNGYSVKVNTQRLIVFSKSTVCAHCGLSATYFAIERHRHEIGRFHLNLYGLKNGAEILFTKDHIIPLSKGGPNRLNNLQTLCVGCNSKKGNLL